MSTIFYLVPSFCDAGKVALLFSDLCPKSRECVDKSENLAELSKVGLNDQFARGRCASLHGHKEKAISLRCV